MKLLWVTFGQPYPPDSGVRMRDFHLIQAVSRHARVHLFCLVPAHTAGVSGALPEFFDSVESFRIPHASGFLQVCQALLGLLAGRPLAAGPYFVGKAARRLREIITREAIDILQIEHSLLGAYLQAVPPGSRCRTVLSLHNIAFAQYRAMAGLPISNFHRAAYRVKSLLMARAERLYARRFDRCLVVSRQEGRLLQHLNPRVAPAVIENGVDSRKLQPLPDDSAELVILFAGMMFYPPNTHAALELGRSILPRVRCSVPEAKLILAGHAPPAEVQALAAETGIEVTGHVQDLLPYYRRSTLTAVPLRAGGGTRLKILESMALGRAVVSTSCGCEGLAVQNGTHLLIADEPGDFADCVVRLLREPRLRAELAHNARVHIERHYDWEIISRKLIELYRSLGANAAMELHV